MKNQHLSRHPSYRRPPHRKPNRLGVDHPGHSHRHRWLLCGLACLLVGWWLWRTPAAPAPVPMTAHTAFPWDRAAPAAQAAPDPAPAVPMPEPSAVATTAEEWDVCSLGKMRVSGNSTAGPSGGFDALPSQVGRDALNHLENRTIARLMAGPPRERVAALVMSAPTLDAPPTVRAQWAESVLQQARESRDPFALTWAEAACGHVADGTGCRQALIRTRIALDPANGRHWLALAEESPQHQEEAWQGLASATRWTEDRAVFETLMYQAMPPDAPQYLRRMMDARVNERGANLPQLGESFLQERCKATDAKACEPLIQLMTQPGAGMDSLASAASLARKLGWSQQRQDALNALTRARVQQAVQDQASNLDPLSCDSLHQWATHKEHTLLAQVR